MKESYVTHVINAIHTKRWICCSSPSAPHYLWGDLCLQGDDELNPETLEVEHFVLSYKYRLFKDPLVVLKRFKGKDIPKYGRRVPLNASEEAHLLNQIEIIRNITFVRIQEENAKDQQTQESLRWWP